MSRPAPITNLPRNTRGRDFVVGDIHGCFDLLDDALVAVNFDPACDRLIALGDLIDRGPNSADCTSYLGQPWFYCVRGNHEDMYLDIVKSDGSIKCDGFMKRVPPFMDWIHGLSDTERADLRTALAALPYAFEIDTACGRVGIVHADIPLGMGWAEFRARLTAGDNGVTDIAAWSHDRVRNAETSGISGIARVYFGHTVVGENPLILGNCIHLDTGAVFAVTGEAENGAPLCLTLADICADIDTLSAPAKTGNPLVRIARSGQNKRAPRA